MNILEIFSIIAIIALVVMIIDLVRHEYRNYKLEQEIRERMRRLDEYLIKQLKK